MTAPFDRLLILALAAAAGIAATPHHVVPPAKHGGVVVGLCDGKTSLEVEGLKPGERMSREKAQAVSDALMAEWEKKNPGSRWEEESRRAEAAEARAEPRTVAGASDAQPPPSVPPRASTGSTQATGGQPKGAASPGQAPEEGVTAEQGAPQAGAAQGQNVQAQTYGAFGARDEAIWRASTDHFLAEGKRLFHDADALGGTIGVSCDMCHPDAANTHPETYPKYQVQLGRVALLRDMINWCIENPLRGKPLPDGDPRLKAVEAYIYAQRKGVPLEYGKH